MDIYRGVFVIGPDAEANGEKLRELVLEHSYPQDRFFSLGVEAEKMVAFEEDLPALRFGSPIVFDPAAPYVGQVDLWYHRDWDSLTWAVAVAQRQSASILALDVKAPHAGWVLGAAAGATQVFASITEEDPDAAGDLFRRPAGDDFSLVDFVNVIWVDPAVSNVS